MMVIKPEVNMKPYSIYDIVKVSPNIVRLFTTFSVDSTSKDSYFWVNVDTNEFIGCHFDNVYKVAPARNNFHDLSNIKSPYWGIFKYDLLEEANKHYLNDTELLSPQDYFAIRKLKGSYYLYNPVPQFFVKDSEGNFTYIKSRDGGDKFTFVIDKELTEIYYYENNTFIAGYKLLSLQFVIDLMASLDLF